jgi:two-component sensor histidine kinase
MTISFLSPTKYLRAILLIAATLLVLAVLLGTDTVEANQISPPTNVTVIPLPEGRSLNISWDPEGSNADYFKVYLVMDQTSRIPLAAVPSYVSFYVHTGLDAGKPYSYSIASLDDNKIDVCPPTDAVTGWPLLPSSYEDPLAPPIMNDVSIISNIRSIIISGTASQPGSIILVERVNVASWDTINVTVRSSVVTGWFSLVIALRGELELIQAEEGKDVKVIRLENSMNLTNHMTRLVAQVGVLCQTQAPETLRPVGLLDSIERVVEDLKIRDKNSCIQIDMEFPEDTIYVSADNLLDNLFMNILDNAIRFSDKERPDVKISIERLQVLGEEMANISISDNGPGIPDEDKSAVFYKFFRRFDTQESNGLGLHLVKNLVKRYHGKVWIEDRVTGRPSKGAKVIVQIPTASPAGTSGSIKEALMGPVASPDHQLGVD